MNSLKRRRKNTEESKELKNHHKTNKTISLNN